VKNRRGDKVTRRHGDEERLVRVSASPRLRVAASSRVPLITLLTDFGTADYFVSAVKGVILTSNPSESIVDITHDILPGDVEAAAFTLLAAYSSFPAGTIHLAVVDPGVGSSRRAILVRTREQFFVGPDNGIFSYVLDRYANPPTKIFHLTNQQYFREPVSPTFHGRDVFAPVAAALSKGVKPHELGTRLTGSDGELVRLKPIAPVTSRDGRIKGRIIHIDRFGNCVTNIPQNDLTAKMFAGGATLRIKGKVVKSFRNFFAEEIGSRKSIFAVWGSAGFLEIAVANESAAKILKAQRGDPVIVAM
jgi:S-adenosylmethionine hydrolase